MIRFSIVEHGTTEYDRTVDLRDEVLRRPLHIAFSPEQLAAERDDIHLACYQDDSLVACLVLTPKADGEIKMRQVAVAPGLQRSGIGRQLVEESEKIARQHGYSRMVLNARDTAIPFYEKLGYHTVGDQFTEVGIPHFRMEKEVG